MHLRIVLGDERRGNSGFPPLSRGKPRMSTVPAARVQGNPRSADPRIHRKHFLFSHVALAIRPQQNGIRDLERYEE